MSDQTTPNPPDPMESPAQPERVQSPAPAGQPSRTDDSGNQQMAAWAGLLVMACAVALFCIGIITQTGQSEASIVGSSSPSPLPVVPPTRTPTPPATSTPARTPTAMPTVAPTHTPTGPVYPLAVMVENMIDARPQSGLARADVVYEALVEGGITRFLAVYKNGSDAPEIGPIRSARHYYVYLAAEFNAAYIHIGASPQGYAALNATGITHLDETYGDPGFWRSDARYAPHNAYTSTGLLREALDKVRKLTPGSMAGFKFDEQPRPAQGTPSKGLTIYFPGHEVGYGYSPETRSYLRSMDGLPHKDADSGERVSPLNVVVQYVRSWSIDEVDRQDMELVGQGKALFFRDGVVAEGSWRKQSFSAPTQWLDAKGAPVLMSPGKIWVQMVPPGTRVEY